VSSVQNIIAGLRTPTAKRAEVEEETAVSGQRTTRFWPVTSSRATKEKTSAHQTLQFGKGYMRSESCLPMASRAVVTCLTLFQKAWKGLWKSKDFDFSEPLASYHESFGVALAEAMACKCVPVVTRRAALPEVVGDCEIYVPYDDAEATAKAIGKALGEEELGKSARERVVNMFSIEERERKLTELISTLQTGQADLGTKSGTRQDY